MSYHPAGSFDSDLKWCPACAKRVRYLLGGEHSWCSECGGKCRLFSPAERERFNTAKARKTGRPAKPLLPEPRRQDTL